MAVMTFATEMMAHGDWGSGGWWPIFPVFWILVWGAVIFAIFRFRRGHSHHHPSAADVLGERYARGEIDADEYQERLNVLKAHNS